MRRGVLVDSYSGFAEVYDSFMDNVPYEEWCGGICDILKGHGITSGIVLDLGCGTGRMTRLLRDRGFDMIGVDVSWEMLDMARSKDSEGILYLEQDMREFELYGTVAAVVCVCDCINYILNEDELLKVFSLVNNYLDPGGIFIFDMNTVYKYREILGDCTICENREHESFIWENFFLEDEMINEYDLTLFVERESGLFEKMEEVHTQRAYEADAVARLIEKSGLKLLNILGEDMRSGPGSEDERIYFVAQERGK